eukprot:TRINITY_DN4821_c0_g1_i1.p1 TRINITY_DN4821_c0_g1~~TRINITY_DN4821_c0_g1_i1.p1  ORF type:complete len:1004 (+),score=313.12 TRINITY_DN4821_c0_g1_i1:310-3321(+)
MPYIKKIVVEASKKGVFSIELKFCQAWYSDPSNQQYLMKEIIKQDLQILTSHVEEGEFFLSICWAGFKGGKQLFQPQIFTIANRQVVIFGGTGMIGKSILDSLFHMQTKFNVRACGYKSFLNNTPQFTNNYPGIDFMYCDYTEQTIKKALSGAKIVVLILPLNAKRIKTCKTVIEIAKTSKTLQHFIFISSIRGENSRTNWGLQYYNCEKLLEESGLTYTIIQIGMLQQSFFPNDEDKIRLPTKNAKIPVLDVNDVGLCLQKVINDSENYENSVIALTGTHPLSGTDLAIYASNAFDRDIEYVSVEQKELKEILKKSDKKYDIWTIDVLLEFFEDYAQGNYNWITDDFERIVGKPPQSFLSTLCKHYRIDESQIGAKEESENSDDDRLVESEPEVRKSKNKNNVKHSKNKNNNNNNNNEDNEKSDSIRVLSDTENSEVNHHIKKYPNVYNEKEDNENEDNEKINHKKTTDTKNKVHHDTSATDDDSPPKIYHSKVQGDIIVDSNISVTQYIFQGINEEQENNTALINPSFKQLLKIDYKTFYSMIKKTAEGLMKNGFKKGDVLSIVSYNHHDYLVCFFACALIGGCCVLVPKGYTPEQLAKVFEETNTTHVVTIAKFKPLVQQAVKQRKEIQKVWYFFASLKGEDESFWSLMKFPVEKFSPPKINTKKDVVLITYPQPYAHIASDKNAGINFTHANLIASLQQMALTEKSVKEKSVCASFIPFTSNFSLMIALHVFHKRSCLLVKNKIHESTLKIVEEFSITHIFLTPPLANFFHEFKDIDQHNLSSLKFAFSSYSRLSKDLVSFFHDKLKVLLYQFLTLPDSNLVTFSSEKIISENFSSFGKLLPGLSAKIVDLNGVTMPEKLKEPGELCLKGPNIAHSYTDKSIKNVDDEGYLHTGLICFIVKNQIYIVERKSNVLTTLEGRYKYPSVVEDIISNIEGVSDVTVIENNSAVHAFVVSHNEKIKNDNSDPILRSIHFHFVKEIPRTKTGLVDKSRLALLLKK